jgi:hypothetical protein
MTTAQEDKSKQEQMETNVLQTSITQGWTLPVEAKPAIEKS